MLVLLASLLYLRQNNSLIDVRKGIGDEGEMMIRTGNDIWIYPSVDVIEKTCNEEFIKLMARTLSQFGNVEDKQELLEVADMLNNVALEDKDWLAFYDMILSSSTSKYYGVFTQPHELSQLASFLLGSKVRRIFDPFGGVMDFATTIIKDRDYFFTANEINYNTSDIAMFRLAMAGVLNQCKINHQNSEEWVIDKKFDAIVTLPPFGLKMHMRDDHGVVNENSEIVALKRFEETTYEDGQLITIVPASFLTMETSSAYALRERLTKRNLLDCVIQLPGGIFPHTGLVTAVIVLKKHREKGQRIKFIDASTCVKKDNQYMLDVEAVKRLYDECGLELTTEEILNQKCTWNVQWYWNRLNAEYSQGYTVVRLADLITPVRSARRYPETRGHVVSVGNLSSDCFSYEKRPEDFPMRDIVKNAVKITEPAFFVSLMGAPKPTYCKASEELPVFVRGDIFVFKISNKTIHEGYFCKELAKRLIPTMGALYPKLTKTQILETCVEFPSLDEQRSIVEQKNIFEQARQTAGLDKEKMEWLEALLEKRKHEYIEEVRNRKHDMKTPMGQMRSTLKLLESLANQITGEPAEKLRLYVQRQRRAMDTLSEIVSHIADEEVFATPEPINLSEVLSSCQTATEKYVVAYYPDEAVLKEAGLTKPMVMMGKSDLLRLVQNIIGNAVERGFVDDYPEYSLNISLTIKKGFYIIDFSNNGRPLPEGMTKERYGMKGVKGKGSDGEGKGGYIVKSITEHYGGDYDVYSQQFAGMWFTHVIVKLPIYQDNE